MEYEFYNKKSTALNQDGKMLKLNSIFSANMGKDQMIKHIEKLEKENLILAGKFIECKSLLQAVELRSDKLKKLNLKMKANFSKQMTELATQATLFEAQKN